MKFLSPVCALAILGACCNLWWFAAGSAALLTWMHFALIHTRTSAGSDERRRLQPSAATVLSLVAYALLLSIAILTTRAALGLLELPIIAFEQAQLAPAMRRSSLGFYDKAELRLALAELVLLTVTWSMVFVQAASYRALQRSRALVLHPASAAFAFVLYFVALRLPPYPIDLEQWVPLIASDSAWPTASGASPVLLAAWLSCFGLSPLSLAMAATLCSLVAGWASFELIRRLTGSPVTAMFGASCALLEATTIHVAAVTLPAPAHVALAMLLMYLGLQPRAGFPWAVCVLGLVLAWDPLFGASACAGFLFALGCQALRRGRLHALAALLAGIGLSLVAIWVTRAIFGPLPLPGVAPTPEAAQFASPVHPLFIPGLLLAALVLRRSGRFRLWTVRRLFVCATLICALPGTYLAVFRLDPGASLQVFWILVPIVALAFYGVVRAIGRAARAAPMRMRAALSKGISILIFVVLFDVFFPVYRLNLVVARYALGYESERQKWYNACATGKACDPARKPTLAFYLRQAARPFAESAGAQRAPA